MDLGFCFCFMLVTNNEFTTNVTNYKMITNNKSSTNVANYKLMRIIRTYSLLVTFVEDLLLVSVTFVSD